MLCLVHISHLLLVLVLKVVVTVVQRIMTEFNGAVTEEAKIVTITKIFLNLMSVRFHGHDLLY
jgi:hypothetical protein